MRSGNKEGPEAPRPSAHTDSRWTARLPTARLPFCRGKKARIGSTGCGVSFERGQIKPVSDAFTRASQIFMEHREEYVSPTRRISSALFCFALRRVSHGVCAIISAVQHQHGQTAATALQLQRTLDHTYLFCAIIS